MSTTILTAPEVAARWKCNKKLVYRLAREGKVPTVPIPGVVRFRESDLEKFEANEWVPPGEATR